MMVTWGRRCWRLRRKDRRIDPTKIPKVEISGLGEEFFASGVSPDTLCTSQETRHWLEMTVEKTESFVALKHPSGATAKILKYGATVIEWKSANGTDNLFLST